MYICRENTASHTQIIIRDDIIITARNVSMIKTHDIYTQLQSIIESMPWTLSS